MSHESVLSPEGYERLKAELDHLKSVERQRIADNIREAKSHGDLRENAMYHEAKLNQRRLESRIADLERLLQTAQVVSAPAAGSGEAHLGSVVRVKDLEWGEELTFVLVGAFEADPANNKVSVASPLGSALLGQSEGSEVTVSTPGGEQRYQVVRVEPAG
jgi:transcription elongation factor GreA